MSLRLAVFASGSGTNLQALIDRFNSAKTSPVRVALVVSNRPDAGALQRAKDAGIDTYVVEVPGRPTDFVTREMLGSLEGSDIDMIALAGYLNLIPPSIIRRYRNRIVNIHPALLPAFGGKGMYGLRVHRAVLDSGATVSGATVHYVNDNYDEGGIIAQWPVPVVAGDTPETLAARVLGVEHVLYPAAVELVAHAVTSGSTVTVGTRAAAFTTINADAPDEAELRRALGVD